MMQEQEPERAFLLALRKARLIEVRAIEERYQTRTVTVTLRRDEAKRLGVLNSTQP